MSWKLGPQCSSIERGGLCQSLCDQIHPFMDSQVVLF